METPKAVRDWYRDIGKRGVAGRLATLSDEEKREFARKGAKASAKVRKANAERARQSGTDAAGQ